MKKELNHTISQALFEDYLNCPTKCFLRASGEKFQPNFYANWLGNQNEIYRKEAAKRLIAGHQQENVIINPTDTAQINTSAWRLAINIDMRWHNIEANLHAAELIPARTANSVDHIIPIRFIFANKLSRIDRLLLAFDALALSKTNHNHIDTGKIIHGDNHTVSKIKISHQLSGEARKIIGKITAVLSSVDPPKLSLNRHCHECEFQERCRRLAIEKDDLSLLSGLSEKEKVKLNNRGIFGVMQLSHTFRPRRSSKKSTPKPEKHHHSLRALSVRENKTHIAGNPQLKIEGTPVFFDVEGLPDRDFYYLIGMHHKSAEGIVQQSLWADTAVDEKRIWEDFLAILSVIEQPVLLHYGSYETIFIKRMCEKYGMPPDDSVAAKAIRSAVNVLSVIFAQIYFPVYSNSLKEIAKYLGFKWDSADSSGLHSLVWRYQWETSKDSVLKDKLITYNSNDCEALSLIYETIRQYTEKDFSSDSSNNNDLEIVHTDSLRINPTARLGTFKSTISGLEQINNAALWDYQRNRIYARTGIKPKALGARKQRKVDTSLNRVEKTVVWKVPAQCPECGKKRRKKGKLLSRTVHDIIYGRSSMKRRVVQYLFQTYQCLSCGHKYGFDRRFGHAARKYGWEVIAYFIYNIIGLCVSQSTAIHILNKLFGFNLQRSKMNLMKRMAAGYYLETRENILKRIVSGNLVHADETRANIKGRSAYVWVLTNMQEVVYILSESREGELIQSLLANFKGVLVSDFYAAYDSIDCPQQKCLIHIMRDLNDEIFKNPFDEELKKVVTMFSGLLQPIIATIDSHGLKKYFLKKHLGDVERFYKYLDGSTFKSSLASKYKQRFVKNRDKLFTFLLYDGVPWNNNNAEHAIKSFALLRNIISGPSTKKGTEEYLTLLSVCRTCEYQGVDFLDFLRSGEKDISAYASNRRSMQATNLTME